MNAISDRNEEITKLLMFRDGKGQTVLTVGLIATLFFDTPWSKENREAVTELAEFYFRYCGDMLKWARHRKTGRMHLIKTGTIPLPRKWLLEHDNQDESWEFLFHGGNAEYEASPYCVQALGARKIADANGYFRVSFPLLWFADKTDLTFPELVRDMCSRLKPLSGYAGLGIIESPDWLERMNHQKTVRAIGERFPGLEIESPPITTNHMGHGIKGVNWLTVLSDRWIDKLGGLHYLRIRLNESNFYFYPFDGGLVIQAGTRPEMGDVAANFWPEHYVTLAKVLKPIQIANHYPMHFGGTGGLDHQATMAWINRFDGK